MAKATGLSLSSVQRIWQAHQLQPHRLRTFKRSRDTPFVAKLVDVVGLYLDPPAHTVVLSIDEQSQIQAPRRVRHDYVRHGTTTLFAASEGRHNRRTW